MELEDDEGKPKPKPSGLGEWVIGRKWKSTGD